MRHRKGLTTMALAGAFAVAALAGPTAQAMPPDRRRSGAGTAAGEGEERSLPRRRRSGG